MSIERLKELASGYKASSGVYQATKIFSDDEVECVFENLQKLLAVVEAGDQLAKAFPEAIAVLQREGYKDSAIEFKAVWSAYLRSKAEL